MGLGQDSHPVDDDVGPQQEPGGLVLRTGLTLRWSVWPGYLLEAILIKNEEKLKQPAEN